MHMHRLDRCVLLHVRQCRSWTVHDHGLHVCDTATATGEGSVSCIKQRCGRPAPQPLLSRSAPTDQATCAKPIRSTFCVCGVTGSNQLRQPT
eukprot:18789-Eustigmatos_ZCMA.PRE.1